MQAKNLKFLRNRLFLTQEKFGDYFQLTRHQINSYEIGRANVPPVLVHQLCKFFNLEEDDFDKIDFSGLDAHRWQHLNVGVLEKALNAGKEPGVNEWKEKYYSVLEKYNEALEELQMLKNREGSN